MSESPRLEPHPLVADPERVLTVAAAAAEEAGELLLSYLGRLASSQISSKSIARDLVTEADLKSEELLVKRMRDAFPDFDIESEEGTVDEVTSETRPRWFIDPLDGTINFVHGLPIFSVSMGLYVDKEPQVAVVHLPRLDETFTAIRGGGAFLNGEPIAVSRTATLGDSILGTGFPYRRGELEHSNLENFGRFFYDVRGMRRLGSAAVDLAYVACGRLDGFWELHLAPHDLAAGALLVQEAGGRVSDCSGGDDWLRGGHIVASGPGVFEAIVERVEH
jgi:myo-inositol-1(or 4)-monophosphatase